jgi:hypothetical protein
MNFQSGLLEKTRLVSNVLMVLLLAGNIFFSIQYVSGINQESTQEDAKAATRYQTSHFLKYFIDTVLNTTGAISFEDRVKLENDIRQIHDADLIAQWDAFVASTNTKDAQANAVKLMSMLTNKML